MRTIVILIILALLILGIVLWYILKSDHTLHATKKSEHLHHTQIDTKFFEEGLTHIEFKNDSLKKLKERMHTKIIGMDGLINTIIINILCGGHILVEGLPGLAKTKTIHFFSQLLGLDFKRIQFTPDLLPADIIGTEIYNAKTQEFETKIGPIMTHILLADEINRATPKVQSALLEAMQEQQVTIGGRTMTLPEPFFVLATQNPLEQEGTYPLPEAQIDRFLFKIIVDYPTHTQEKEMLDVIDRNEQQLNRPIIDKEKILQLKEEINTIQISDEIKHYITRLTHATRNHEAIIHGTSPRGSIGLMTASKALALCQGRNFVTHEDVQRVALAVLRHRIILHYQAKVEGKNEDQILIEIFKKINLM